MRTRLALSSACTLTALGLVAGTATAEVVSRTDVSGDAEPRYDIVRTTYANGPQRFVAKVRLRNLRLHVGNALQVYLKPAVDPRRTIVVEAVRRPGGAVATSLWTVRGPNIQDLPCAVRTTWDAGAELASLSLPQSCLGRWAGKQTGVVTMTLDPTDQAEQDDSPGVTVARG